MPTTPTRVLSALAGLALFIALVPTSPAHACGGFFCNGNFPTPIFQAGERVLFVKHDSNVTMHVEVTYDGDPTQFAWLIPVPSIPRDVTGQPLPLGQVVGLSSQMLFPTLQAATNPTWQLVRGLNEGRLCDGGGGGGCADAASINVLAGQPNSVVPEQPGVTVSDTAKVGPYDAELIEASSSDALYTWLDTNGYSQDQAAKPLLAHYVSQGFSFIGVRLQNGKGTGDIKPIALTLGENAPCVPLRLTSIAAVDGMPIRVWVLGDSRAVPKNFLHAVVNERAIQYPGGQNYDTVVDLAIQAAGGKAFVTEFAGDVAPVRDQFFLGSLSETLAAIDSASTKAGAINAVSWKLPISGNIDLMQLEEESGSLELSVLKQRLKDEVVIPLSKIESLLNKGTTLTRLYTRIDPGNMTRDPIFAFNPSLPDVAPSRVAELGTFTDSECKEHNIVTYADGERRSVPVGSTTINVTSESPLERVEVLDETGTAVAIAMSKVDEVNALLDRATLGVPSIPPETLDDFAATPLADRFNAPPGYDELGGCQVGGVNATAVVLALCLGLLWWRRRQAQSSFA